MSSATPVPSTSIAAAHEVDVIDASGPDVVAYLQGQISADVDALAVGASVWSMVLQPTGRLDGWFRLHRAGDTSFLLVFDAGAGEPALARLRRFLLRTDASFELRTVRSVAIHGPAAGAVEASDEVVVIDVGFGGDRAVEMLGATVPTGAEATVVDADALRARRIRAGRPAYGAELDDRTIPAEAGIVDVSASFTKGCYTGQELVARMDARGAAAPRSLRVLHFGGAAPAAGTALVVDGDEVGEVTSVATDETGTVGLGYLKRSAAEATSATVDGITVELGVPG